MHVPVNQDAPIINHAVAAVMEPMTLVGTVFGVMLNKTLPNWAILAMLIALLVTITYKTAEKGFKVGSDHGCGAALVQRLSLYAVPRLIALAL